MRLAGQYTFTATPSQAGGPIRWTIDREERSENGGKSKLARNVAATVGPTATFNLAKIAGKETVYIIRAGDNGFSDTHRVQVFPPDERASFIYKSTGNPDVRVYIVAPATLSANTHIVMVMHGRGRNADDYINSWVEWAGRNDYIILCPQFDNRNWPGTRGYNLGNIFTGEEGRGKLNPESKWSFTIVENIHQLMRDGFAIKDELFDLWGHSAGGQFVHRLMLFKPNAKVRFAMPANAGWYTAPDLNTDFPSGARHPLSFFTMKNLTDYTNKQMIIMRGALDIERAENLRTTPDADAQGLTRFERAGYMFAKGKAVNPRSNWQLIDVPNADHDQAKMALAAQQFLQKPNLSLPH